MKKIIKEYFSLTRKESYISIILVVILAFFIALPYYQSTQKKHEPVDSVLSKIVANDLLVNDSGFTDNFEYKYKNYYNNAKKDLEIYTITPFEFDPNLIDSLSWQKLGLPTKVIKTILNYRNKGGKFNSADEIRKIWGLKKEDADILIPFISIANRSNTYNNNGYISYKKYEKPLPKIIDINTALMEDFRILPLVGNAAYKIVRYRERLGGFININQLKENNCVTDSVFEAMLPYLKIIEITIQKLNINVLTDFDLSKHPYITRDIAKAIEIYRTQHGRYTKIEDIKKIVFINQATFLKIAPYITVD